MTIDAFAHVHASAAIEWRALSFANVSPRSLIKTIERDDAISPEIFGRIERLFDTSM
jgi:hypothetical protein